ncbi:hypothetical protein LJB42_000550 [Komagataella kurtzmanii]|nr:hypothetical protein LJB42_000550 [Komagataella kurtzmanii]
MPPYAQIVIGPPGSGKSTYCNGMNQFLSSIGRYSMIINLDPANDQLPYDVTIDIRDYITLEEIMDETNLGPNGGLVFAMQTFKESIEEFISEVRLLIKRNHKAESAYLIFDCPGQVELYTNNDIVSQIFRILQKDLDFRLVVVSLTDSINIMKPSSYISSLLLALRSMLQMDLPQINVFSKIDLLKGYIEQERYGRVKPPKEKGTTTDDGLPFSLEYYTQVQDLKYLLPYLEVEENNTRTNFFKRKYYKLNEAISDLIEDFSLLSFEVLSIEDKNSMISLLAIIDRANGYSMGSNELGNDTIWEDAVRQSSVANFLQDINIHERWVDEKEKYDEVERIRREKQFKEATNNEELLNQTIDPEKDWEDALKKWETSTGKPAFKV